jgi:ELWxxDGT repeat protein
MVKDIEPGPDGSGPGAIAAFRGVILFAATTDRWGGEPWRSDGTAAGTYLLKDIDRPGS